MRAGYVFDLRFLEWKIQPISMIFGIPNNEWWNFKKCYCFFVDIKSFEISAYIENRIFTKNVNNFDIPRQIFPWL